MSPLAWANSTTADKNRLLFWLLLLPQPLFLIAVLIPSVLFDPVFSLPFITFHIFFTALLAFYSWALFVLRDDDNLRHRLTAVTALSISMWLLLSGVHADPLYTRLWTAIYFQNVCLQTVLFLSRNKTLF
jgi:hypothetical protein